VNTTTKELAMSNRQCNSMGLAEAAAHLAALSAITWLLEHVRAREALAIVEDRCAGSVGHRAECAAARSVDRLCRQAGRLGLETAAAPQEAS